MGNPGLGLEWSEAGRGVMAIPPVSEAEWKPNDIRVNGLVKLGISIQTTCAHKFIYFLIDL